VSRITEEVNLETGLGGLCGGTGFLLAAAVEDGLLTTNLLPTCWPCA